MKSLGTYLFISFFFIFSHQAKALTDEQLALKDLLKGSQEKVTYDLNKINEISLNLNDTAIETTLESENSESLLTLKRKVLSNIPNCFCVLEYQNFPLKERFYRQAILFFSYFNLPNNQPDRRRFSNICELYYTLGSGDQEIHNAFQRIETKYALNFTKIDLSDLIKKVFENKSYFQMIETSFGLCGTATTYGILKVLSKKTSQIALLAGGTIGAYTLFKASPLADYEPYIINTLICGLAVYAGWQTGP